MGKIAGSKIISRKITNKRNSFIRKIHIRVEKSIHIVTSNHHFHTHQRGSKRGKIFFENHQLFELALIFSVRMMKELFSL